MQSQQCSIKETEEMRFFAPERRILRSRKPRDTGYSAWEGQGDPLPRHFSRRELTVPGSWRTGRGWEKPGREEEVGEGGKGVGDVEGGRDKGVGVVREVGEGVWER